MVLHSREKWLHRLAPEETVRFIGLVLRILDDAELVLRNTEVGEHEIALGKIELRVIEPLESLSDWSVLQPLLQDRRLKSSLLVRAEHAPPIYETIEGIVVNLLIGFENSSNPATGQPVVQLILGHSDHCVHGCLHRFDVAKTTQHVQRICNLDVDNFIDLVRNEARQISTILIATRIICVADDLTIVLVLHDTHSSGRGQVQFKRTTLRVPIL